MASETTIQLGTVFEQNLSALPGGPVPGTERDFTLTFNCPKGTFDGIWFRVVPVAVNPAVSGINGVMSNHTTGSNMATGGAYSCWKTSQLPAMCHSSMRSMPPVAPGTLLSDFGLTIGGSMSVDILTTPMIEQPVNLRACLYRLNQPVTPGQIKVSAIVHLVYP